MSIEFYKYQGAGNDFIIIDDRNNQINIGDSKLIAQLCNRRFGIGADGLMLLRNADGYDFRMVYFNSDGHEGSMCGNGGRCIAAFAHYLGILKKEGEFIAIDGPHKAIVRTPAIIELEMIPVNSIEQSDSYFFMDTGSPHYVQFVKGLDDMDVYTEGRKIRYNERFSEIGTNVNFAELKDNVLHVRTYERGVENETLACGTGITASAISAALVNNKHSGYKIKALGGELEVKFNRVSENNFDNIWLIGPAEQVFKGVVILSS